MAVMSLIQTLMYGSMSLIQTLMYGSNVFNSDPYVWQYVFNFYVWQ